MNIVHLDFGNSPKCRKVKEEVVEILWKEGIKTTEDLVTKKETELLRLSRFGNVSLEYLKKALAKIGKQLRN